MAETMLTTVDNPFNPFTQWREWYAYDIRAGHHTSSYLAKIVHSSHELSEADQLRAIDDAIDEILKFNPLGIYKRISSDE